MSEKPLYDLESLEKQIDLRRNALVFALAKGIYQRLSQTVDLSTKVDSEPWIEIESLSQLRGLVGGRFATIKAHWVKAGFPLRAHRGDRSSEVVRDAQGWLDLVVWLDSQGYLARPSEGEKSVCFEIRPKESK